MLDSWDDQSDSRTSGRAVWWLLALWEWLGCLIESLTICGSSHTSLPISNHFDLLWVLESLLCIHKHHNVLEWSKLQMNEHDLWVSAWFWSFSRVDCAIFHSMSIYRKYSSICVLLFLDIRSYPNFSVPVLQLGSCMVRKHIILILPRLHSKSTLTNTLHYSRRLLI